MKIFFIVALLLICRANLIAGETNKLFITINEWDKDVSDYKQGTNEYLPAKQFPDGNWGQPTNGIQLSLRFDKLAYSNGAPIIATILLRNVTTQTVEYQKISSGGFDGPVRFAVTTVDNRKIESLPWGEGSAKSDDVIAGSQRKFVERFDKEFHLTNGTYFVRAYVVAGYRIAHAESARVPITITNVSKYFDQANK